MVTNHSLILPCLICIHRITIFHFHALHMSSWSHHGKSFAGLASIMQPSKPPLCFLAQMNKEQAGLDNRARNRKEERKKKQKQSFKNRNDDATGSLWTRTATAFKVQSGQWNKINIVEIKETASPWGAPGPVRALYYMR